MFQSASGPSRQRRRGMGGGPSQDCARHLPPPFPVCYYLFHPHCCHSRPLSTDLRRRRSRVLPRQDSRWLWRAAGPASTLPPPSLTVSPCRRQCSPPCDCCCRHLVLAGEEPRWAPGLAPGDLSPHPTGKTRRRGSPALLPPRRRSVSAPLTMCLGCDLHGGRVAPFRGRVGHRPHRCAAASPTPAPPVRRLSLSPSTTSPS